MREVPFGRPILREEEKQAALEVLNGNVLVHGPKAYEFEASFANYTGAAAATSTSSCTTALHLSYLHAGIGPGDEVIVPAQTHVATVHAVEYVGATPKFVDAEGTTGNIDLQQLEQAVTPRTKAISVVHYLGMPVDMDSVMQFAGKHGLFVVEDCALAIGTFYRGKHAGLFGDTGCFSFYPVKHITTAEGGMLISKNKELVKDVALRKAFGVDRSHAERSIPGVYDVVALGYNFRLNEVAAALGIEQVKRIGSFLETRKTNYEALYAGLSELPELEFLQSSHGEFQSSYYCFSAILKPTWSPKRMEVVAHLKSKGVGTSIYYPKPVPHLQYYREKYGFVDSTFPQASRLSYEAIALPVGPHLSVEDMDYIVATMKEALTAIK